MQPLSGNQLLELRTSLLKMPLVLRLPRKMHLCRSSSNFPRLPSFLKMLQHPHVLVAFQWMHNPIHLPHKTTSERPKCLRASVCNTFGFEMCFTPCTFSTSQLPKVLRDRQFLTLFTSKCASRHNAVHFFVISTSKTVPRPPVFNTFYFQMCFECRALFQHLNFQKWSDPEVFCTFSLRNRLRATTACNFSSLICPDISAPTALASLLFNSPEPHHEKHSVSRLSYLFAHLHLLSSDLFSSDSSPC